SGPRVQPGPRRAPGDRPGGARAGRRARPRRGPLRRTDRRRRGSPVSGDRPLGVVVMAYGTPRSPGEIEPYYTHLRRGRPPPPELLAELTARYEATGGTSPLAERTEAQRAALDRALDERMPGRWKVVLGQKHAAPFIEDAVADLAGAGVTEAVG